MHPWQDGSAHHIVDEQLRDPASYLTVRRSDRVYDVYGWMAGRVAEPRITEDKHFDGLVVEFRGRRLFVDAPEVGSVHDGLVVLGLTVADLTRAASDPDAPACWPGGPPQVPPRRQEEPAAADDAVALMAALSRMYVAGRLSVTALEAGVERVLSAETGADLDAIAARVLADPAAA